ncbi:CyP450 monooxygenase [Pilatotrama ljubarskyi]|nr:CyP450 monooxygenase [Pilatotrama ljubarskyi]
MFLWLCILLFLCGFVAKFRRTRDRRPLPPGPRGVPILGNILDFPTSDLARGFNALAARYGEMVYLEILGKPILVLNTYEVACEFMDRRSRAYADRPDSVMARLATLTDFSLPLIPYGDRWRRHRRVYHQTLQQKMIRSRYHDKLTHVTRLLLSNLLDSPREFSRHVDQRVLFNSCGLHAFAASVLSIGYGIQISEKDDRFVNMLHTSHDLIEAIVVPGKYLVEVVPVLQYLPSWIPGLSFRRDSQALREEVRSTMRVLYEEGKRGVEAGRGSDSMLATMLQGPAMPEGKPVAEEEEECAGVAVTTYIAGSDTTVASMRAFLLAMAMYPEVQKKAQDELDGVVGRSRLPDLNDRSGLPYVNALVKELSRWHVVAPIGLARAALEDDEYNGYHIPRGTTVITNLWAYSRDPAIYPDPETFNPDRFLKDGKLNSDARDPYSFIFGFGRRICPGRHLADASLFLTCAAILHVLSITPPLDEDGCPQELKAKMTTHLIISHPEEFDCVIKPRWANAADLVR